MTDESARRRQYDRAYLAELSKRAGLLDIISRRVKLRRNGRDHVGLCPFHKERTPSFTVSEDKGFFHCFGCGAHGDVISFVMRSEGRSFSEAVELLSCNADLPPRFAGQECPKPPPAACDECPRFDKEQRDRIAAARKIWDDSKAAPGSLAQHYLRARGITVAVPPSIRFHPGLKHRPSGLVLPCMVASVQSPDGAITAIHRTWLRPDGRGKAPVVPDKMALGVLGRGAARLGPDAPVMGIAEGIESALSAAQLFNVPVWAALGCRLDQIEPPYAAAHLLVFADNGAAGSQAADGVRKAQRSLGRRITVKAPPNGVEDWNESLVMEGWAS